MEIKNLFNGGADNSGPNTPTKDKNGNEQIELSNDPKTSRDSEVQDGKDVVNEQEQNDIVNGQDGSAAEEYVNSANNSTKVANDSPLNNENGRGYDSGVMADDDDDDDDDDKDDDPLKEIEIGDDPEEEKKKIPIM